MSHKHDDLRIPDFDSYGVQTIANPWMPAATVDDEVSVPDPFENFQEAFVASAATGRLTSSAAEAATVNVTEGGKTTIAGPGTDAVAFAGSSGTLLIDSSQDFRGDISGLSGSDTIDLADIAFNAGTQATFVGTASGGTLTVSNGTETAEIALTGDYLSSTWSLSNDGNGGTNVVDPTAASNWQVMKVGAGGWADGLDEAPDGTIVVRTDTNGAYLWNGSSWQQLVTATSLPAAFIAANPVSSGQGVYEIQIAPSNSNIMYMVFDGYVFVSANKGTTWTQTSFKQVTAEPNDSYRMYRQKMAVDPSNSNIVYVGTPQNGLWVTTNGGTTWAQVTAVPVSGTISGAYPGITGILFDPAIGGVVNGVTQTIFASSYGNGVYESTNGGSLWTKLSGGPSNVESATVGPNGAYYAVGDSGQDLWRYYNGSWTELIAGNNGQGVQAVVINPNNSNEIVAVAASGVLNVSYNGGATWSGIDWSFAVKSADIPWEAAAQTGTSGGMYLTVGGAAFSLSTPNELILSTGTGSFDVMVPTTSLTGTITYNDMSTGIENLVANEILVAPGGTPVLASWDRPFIKITDLNSYPTSYGPVASDTIVAGWSVDYASSTPSFLVGIADFWGVEESGYSTDGGVTWKKFTTEIPGAGSSFIGGSIAASTTQNFIWAPADGNVPYYTLNGGQTWSAITLPGVTSWSSFDWAYYLTGRTVTADRVLANTFYLYYGGIGVFETTNGGQTWAEVYKGPIAPNDGFNNEIMAVPGQAGNLFWTAGMEGNGTSPPANSGFYFSSNQGASWTAIPNVLEVICFGFGAAAPGQTYPSIYIVGYVNNIYGVWQSINKGQSWTQLGTIPAGELDKITTISGDPNVFGQVYVGFSGGGYAYLSGGAYVTGVTTNPTSGAESPGATVKITVNMSAAVTISGGNPTLNLNDGGVATYVSGSGTSALTFTYTVASTDTAVSALAVSSTSLNGATLQDASGNVASLAGAVATFSGLSVVESVSVAYYLANQSTLDAAGTVMISDTAANVAAAIATLNADTHVSAITLLGSTNLHLSAAQALNDTRALNAITNSTYGITVTDTGANISADFDNLNADSHITTIIPTGGSQTLTLTLTQMQNDTHALSLLDPFEITVTGTAASLQALATAQLTDFADDNVTLLDAMDADLSLTLAQKEAMSAGGISLEEPYSGGTVQVISFNATGAIATIDFEGIAGQPYTWELVTYNSSAKPSSASFSNGMTETWTYNADGSRIISLVGVTGATYTAYTVDYRSDGNPTSASYNNGKTETWTYDADGSRIVSFAGVTGATYTAYSVDYEVDGSRSVTFTGVTGQAYSAYTINYGSNVKPTSGSFNDGQTETWAYNADGSYDLIWRGVPGAPYTLLEGIFDSASVRNATAYDMTDGSGSLMILNNGLKASLGSSSSSITTGADTFAIDPHAVETIVATGYSGETFGFVSGFGKDSITGFVAGGSGADVLSLKLSMFSGLSASNTAAQDIAILLSNHAIAQSGANVTISDKAGDVLTLMGVTTTSLSQYASSAFKFS